MPRGHQDRGQRALSQGGRGVCSQEGVQGGLDIQASVPFSMAMFTVFFTGVLKIVSLPFVTCGRNTRLVF